MKTPGWLFKSLYGKDPRNLSLEEIKKFAIRKKNEIYTSSSNVVIKRGSVFPTVHYEIDEKLNTLGEKLKRGIRGNPQSG